MRHTNVLFPLDDRVVEDWEFDPNKVAAKQSDTLIAVNVGGEFHTFTEVERFGGGFVVLLNKLSGNPVPAPECADLKSTPDANGLLPPALPAQKSFVGPLGGTLNVDVPPVGKTELYQCCIHPWMRAAITGKTS